MRTSQSALAISHHRQIVRRSSHPPQCAEFAERNVISTSGVRRLGCRLADDRQPRSSPPCRFGMGVGQIRILVDEPTRDDQVRRHDLREILGQAAQFGPDRRV